MRKIRNHADNMLTRFKTARDRMKLNQIESIRTYYCHCDNVLSISLAVARIEIIIPLHFCVSRGKDKELREIATKL